MIIVMKITIGDSRKIISFFYTFRHANEEKEMAGIFYFLKEGAKCGFVFIDTYCNYYNKSGFCANHNAGTRKG